MRGAGASSVRCLSPSWLCHHPLMQPLCAGLGFNLSAVYPRPGSVTTPRCSRYTRGWGLICPLSIPVLALSTPPDAAVIHGDGASSVCCLHPLMQPLCAGLGFNLSAVYPPSWPCLHPLMQTLYTGLGSNLSAVASAGLYRPVDGCNDILAVGDR